MADEWGPWIEHDGKGFPLQRGEVAHMVYRSGNQRVATVGLFLGGDPSLVGSSWHWGTGWDDVILYRIRKPRALLDLIERAKELDDAPEGPVRVTDKPKVGA